MLMLTSIRDELKDAGEIDIRLQSQHFDKKHCHACDQELDGDYVELMISDNGPTLSEEELVSLLDGKTSSKIYSQASLSSVQRILHEWNGHIFASQNQPTGVNFHLLFPAVKDEELSNDAPVSTVTKLPLTERSRKH